MKLLDLKIPPAICDVKSQYIAPFCYVLSGIAFLCALIYFKVYHVPGLSIDCLSCGLAALAIVLFHRIYSNLIYSANLLIILSASCVLSISYYTGGTMSYGLWWLCTLPIIASFLLNAAFGFIWSLLILLLFFILLFLEQHSFLPQNMLSNVSPTGRIIFSFVLLVSLVSILCILTELLREKAYVERENMRLKAFQLNQAASLGKLASSIAHEINNPLTIIKGAELKIGRIVNDVNRVDNELLFAQLAKITKSIHRIQSITGLMSKISDNNRQQLTDDINVKALLHEVINILGNDLSHAEIEVNFTCPEGPVFVSGVFAELFQAFSNLIENAIQELQRIEGYRSIKITLESTEHEAIIFIKDNGRGVAKEVQEHIFDPFFTTKKEEARKGLGLSFSFNAFLKNGGRLEFLESPMGAAFKVVLPKKKA